MAGKLTARGAESLAKRRGRYGDGNGLFLRVLDPGKRVYWVYRFTLQGREREMSLGSFPTVSLADARTKHAQLAASVANKIDPLGDRRSAKAFAPTGTPTFGSVADDYLERQEKRGLLGKNSKHRQQWRSTLTKLPAWFRDLPVTDIGPQQVFDALDPIWDDKPETASRLRGRIATVLDAARGPHDTHPNPAAWSGWLKTKLGNPRKLGKIDRKTGERIKRGNHAAMPFDEVPAFMARLARTSGAALALRLTILTACRTSEVLNMTFDEVNFDTATWTIPEKRMKMEAEHVVPLSDAALAIVKAQHAARDGRNPHVFPGRPMKPLSNMSMMMLMRRLQVPVTVHGFRSSFRNWAAKQGVAFEVAEACLAHAVGNAVTRAYLGTTVPELRRPVMINWAEYICPADNVIQLRA
ncbi:MAG TPA: integrase arm-type DNA-binding domain-containing protein [Roseiarcus sp.]|nr:integrase arm-type DNA-binding domain-containing protein [Roseiarcus sp.]